MHEEPSALNAASVSLHETRVLQSTSSSLQMVSACKTEDGRAQTHM